MGDDGLEHELGEPEKAIGLLAFLAAVEHVTHQLVVLLDLGEDLSHQDGEHQPFQYEPKCAPERTSVFLLKHILEHGVHTRETEFGIFLVGAHQLDWQCDFRLFEILHGTGERVYILE